MLNTFSYPRPEYPRPDRQRGALEGIDWLNLNGPWRFTFDPENIGEQQRRYRLPHPTVTASEARSLHDPFGETIVVPFPWESELSGVKQPNCFAAVLSKILYGKDAVTGCVVPRRIPSRMRRAFSLAWPSSLT